MKICSLGSGSKGNCFYISESQTGILVDAGLPVRKLKERLAHAGLSLNAISAILFTHDHGDHYQGVMGLLRECPALPLYATEGTAEGIERAFQRASWAWRIFERKTPFEIGPLTITPFPVPHNAADPVGFIVAAHERRLGLATDLGCLPPLLREALAECHALVLESNYDTDMLMMSGRPWSVKTRIAGLRGHLSNDDAATCIRAMQSTVLQTLLLAHISEECNTTYTAHHGMAEALRECGLGDITLSCFLQNEPSCMYEV